METFPNCCSLKAWETSSQQEKQKTSNQLALLMKLYFQINYSNEIQSHPKRDQKCRHKRNKTKRHEAFSTSSMFSFSQKPDVRMKKQTKAIKRKVESKPGKRSVLSIWKRINWLFSFWRIQWNEIKQKTKFFNKILSHK